MYKPAQNNLKIPGYVLSEVNVTKKLDVYHYTGSMHSVLKCLFTTEHFMCFLWSDIYLIY